MEFFFVLCCAVGIVSAGYDQPQINSLDDLHSKPPATSFVHVSKGDGEFGGTESSYTLHINHDHYGKHYGYAHDENIIPLPILESKYEEIAEHELSPERDEPLYPYASFYNHQGSTLNVKNEHIPIMTDAGVPLDTPEVQLERLRHFKAHAIAKAREHGIYHPIGTYAAGYGYENSDNNDGISPFIINEREEYYDDEELEHHRPYYEEGEDSRAYAPNYDHQKHYYGKEHIPIMTDAGVPLDTPEVQIAKMRHFQAHALAEARANGVYNYPVYTYAAGYNYGNKPHEHVPLMTDEGVPLDTPEVQVAKIQHFNAHAYAKAREENEGGGENKENQENEESGGEKLLYASHYQHETSIPSEHYIEHNPQEEPTEHHVNEGSNNLEELQNVYLNAQQNNLNYGYAYGPQLSLSTEHPFLADNKINEHIEQEQNSIDFHNERQENEAFDQNYLGQNHLEQNQQYQGYPFVRYQQKFVIPSSYNPEEISHYVVLRNNEPSNYNVAY